MRKQKLVVKMKLGIFDRGEVHKDLVHTHKSTGLVSPSRGYYITDPTNGIWYLYHDGVVRQGVIDKSGVSAFWPTEKAAVEFLDEWRRKMAIMNLVINLPRYQCHKQVHALKIKHIIPNPRGYELHFEGDQYCPFEVTERWVLRHYPIVGGYLVIDDSGCRSYSPADEFESGYTLVELDTKPDCTVTSCD